MEKARILRKRNRLAFIIIFAMALTGCAADGTSLTTSVPEATSPGAATIIPVAPKSESASSSASPAPARHPGDPILEYPAPLTGHTRPLTPEEADALGETSGYLSATAHIPDLGEYEIWDRTLFTPARLLGDFEPGELYPPKKVTAHLKAIEWPWGDIYENFDDMVFFQVWEMTLPLMPDPLSLCGIGIYPVDPEDFPTGKAAREDLRMEEGAIYIFTQTASDQWRFLYRIADEYWQVRTQLALAINESNTCAWLVETPSAGTGTGYYDSNVNWYNLITGRINLQYTRYREIAEYLPLTDGTYSIDNQIVSTVLYGLRYDWLPDGTRFIRVPNRMTIQMEKITQDEQLGYVHALMTAELLCGGTRFHLLNYTVEAEEDGELRRQYTFIGGSDFDSGMPSFGYRVRERGP